MFNAVNRSMMKYHPDTPCLKKIIHNKVASQYQLFSKNVKSMKNNWLSFINSATRKNTTQPIMMAIDQ